MPRGCVSRYLNPRGASARYADCGSVQRFTQFNVVRTPVMLNVIPCKVFSTLRDTEARYAECGSGQRDSAERSCSCRWSVIGVCLSLAVYRSSRPTRACSGRRFASSEIGHFSAPVSATMSVPCIGGGAAKAQPVGRVLGETCLDHKLLFLVLRQKNALLPRRNESNVG